MSITTNVTRLLDARKIPHTIFETPTEKLGALETARFLDVEPDSVFKTIVVTREKPRKPLLVVIPGPREVGGISPLALINKGFQVVIDSSAQALGEIHVSGGQRGLNIRLPVEALAKLVNARFAEVCR
jgi:Cys-tRNA(Pro)/Cys-tRNA(Cys) deacylase